MLSLPTVKFLFARHSVHYVKITIYAHYGCGFSKEDIQFLFLTFKVDDFTRTTLFPYRETAENRTRPLCGRGLIHTLGTAVPASIDPARRMFQLKIFKIYIYITVQRNGPKRTANDRWRFPFDFPRKTVLGFTLLSKTWCTIVTNSPYVLHGNE